ncbi:MAG: hypothetical protein QNK37_14320 [Acidobacteriota bacterium]|nr:hypothetical protein [Acidobacteriota bacterium]
MTKDYDVLEDQPSPTIGLDDGGSAARLWGSGTLLNGQYIMMVHFVTDPTEAPVVGKSFRPDEIPYFSYDRELTTASIIDRLQQPGSSK